jgi:hypothetical protein
LRHAAEFGATLTHFHISTLSHFHNSTFSHFQRPHNPPPGGVGIAVCLAADSQNPTSAPLSACGDPHTAPSLSTSDSSNIQVKVAHVFVRHSRKVTHFFVMAVAETFPKSFSKSVHHSALIFLL